MSRNGGVTRGTFAFNLQHRTGLGLMPMPSHSTFYGRLQEVVSLVNQTEKIVTMNTDYLEVGLQRIFPQFSPELISKLDEIGQVVDFMEGDMLMRSGQYFKNSILILEGQVKLYREGEDGELFLYFLEKGNACALSMICAARNEASAIKAMAMTNVKAVSIPIQYMDDLMKNYREWYYFVLETYRSRFNELLEVIDQVVFHSMDEKLESYLKRQFRTFGNTITITHQEIADDLNSSREVISRLLKKLEKQNRISVSRSEIGRLRL
jgi:CRP/FNR family transcriptional regulator, anaerobic regulatory protein